MTRKSAQAQARKSISKQAAAAALRTRIQQAQSFHASGARVLARLIYEEVLAEQPAHAAALQGLGILSGQDGDLQRGIELLDRAIRLEPDNPVFHANRALFAKDLLRLPEAQAGLDRALALKPDYALAQYNQAMLLLLTGQFQPGWSLYESRFRSTRTPRILSRPRWSGDEPLQGRTLLLHAEQGLGDTIQFCRYARLAQQRGARVLVEAPLPLVGLLQTLEGVTSIHAEGSSLPDFDLHCPMMSLPLAFGTGATTIPAPAAYLQADPEMQARWAARLGPRTRPRIGLAWSGSAQNPNDTRRSIALAQWLPSLRPDIDCISLHKDLRPADAEALRAHGGIRHFGEAQTDFTDAAALAAEMDLVVSVDTSLAHLAAAMGRPTWVLLPHMPDWRWQLARVDSPWYPSARLYRQASPGDWAGVLAAVRHDLGQLLG